MESLTGRARPGGLVCAPGLTAFVLYHKPRKKTRREVISLWTETRNFLRKWICVLCFCAPYIRANLCKRVKKSIKGGNKK